jgi:hypothetical protein
MKMTLNRKILNYKVVDLVESYNFHIKLLPSELKELQIFENRLDPTTRPRRYSSTLVPTAVARR